jgi:hypothetical protein
MAYGLPGGTLSDSAGKRLAARLGALGAGRERSGGGGENLGGEGSDRAAQKPWAATGRTRGTRNAAPAKMTNFSENTRDEGAGRATGRLRPDHINEERYQKFGPRMSRGGSVERPGGANHGPDHIDQPANAKLFPPGGKAKRGRARSKVGGKVQPSPRRYLEGAPRREYDDREPRTPRERGRGW